MTARAVRARFDPGSQHRRALIAKVHIAKAQLRLSDDDYRAVIFRVAGQTSAKDCSDAELTAIVEEFGRKGFSSKARASGPRPADHPAARKARALWISLHQLGAIDNPSEQALEAFARRQLGVDRLQWADQALTYRLIEAEKAIAKRHGWDADLSGVKPAAAMFVLKRGLVEAILVKLRDAGLIPADWDIKRAAFELAGIEIESACLATTEDFERIAKALGAQLREASR